MVPYLRVANVLDGFIDYSDVNEMHFSEGEQRKYTLRSGDILLNEGQSTELVGRSAIYDGPEGRYCYQNSLVNFRCGPSVVGPFARAVFKRWLDIGHFTTILKQTTSMAHLGGERFARLEFPLPPLPEQRQVAAILDTIDDAIRRTEQMVAKLKQVKQGLLHDLLSCGIDKNGELRDPERHPEQFKDSPLGRVPSGWEVANLERFLDGPPKNGHSPTAVAEWTGRMMLGLGCLSDEGFVPAQLKNAPRNEPRLDAAVLRDGDLLLSRANTRDLVGLAGIYRDVGAPCTYPDLMMRLTPVAQAARSEFLELVLRSPPLRRQIQAAAVGTSVSMVKVSGSIVRRLIVLMPSLAEQSHILARANACRERAVAEEGHHHKLRLLKAGLMEDLLTGRVRVTKLLESAGS